jgi:hypothetical protein
MIKKREIGCSAVMMTKIADLMNIPNGGCFCHFFDRNKMLDRVGRDHPLFNMAKYQGEIPYKKYSISALGRERDYNVEKR